MRVVGIFLEYNDKFVLLHRHEHKPDGNTWGLPSGKVEENETDLDAALRELFEETGYKGTREELEHLGDFKFTSTSGVPFVYVTYRLKLTNPHKVIIEDNAHKKAVWVTVDKADKMNDLIYGLHELFRYVGFIK